MSGLIVNEPVLCYVSGTWAYFTTNDLSKQWGDDWNDAPYEHNAGDPYEWRPPMNGDEYKIIKVVFIVDMETPADQANSNSRWSVEQINKKCMPWLMPGQFSTRPMEPIFAGTTLEEFKRCIQQYGGEIYVREISAVIIAATAPGDDK